LPNSGRIFIERRTTGKEVRRGDEKLPTGWGGIPHLS
jgi:hypothetical protein